MENKTIGMLMEDAKYEIVKCINESIEEKQIPLYLIEYVLRDIYNEVVDKKKTQLQEDISNWQKAEEEKEKKEQSEKESD